MDNNDIDVFEETMVALKLQNDHLSKLMEILHNHDVAIRQNTSDHKVLSKKVDFIIDNEYVSPAERQKIADAIKNRVTDILRLKDCTESQYNYYYKQFAKKIWIDSKREANVIGKGGVYTKHKHYKDAIDYIGVWEPEGYGIAGYFKHLDIMRKAS